MTTFFLNRLATEPHALAFAGQGIKELDIQFAPMEKIQR